jgi:hypothetical protein
VTVRGATHVPGFGTESALTGTSLAMLVPPTIVVVLAAGQVPGVHADRLTPTFRG